MTAAEAADWTKGREEAKAVAKKHANHHWQNSKHRLQSLKLDGHGLGDFLRHIMQHDYILPLEQLQKSLVYTGSNYRLRKVVHDLILANRPIKVGAIGGSITNGAKASKIGETDWFSLVGSYMKTAFPKANVTTRNGALPATPSALMNMCLEQYVDEDVDLVFVEYVANDGSNRWVGQVDQLYEGNLQDTAVECWHGPPWRPTHSLRKRMPVCSWSFHTHVCCHSHGVNLIALWLAVSLRQYAPAKFSLMLTTPLRCVLHCAQV
jgi:hypothetical protein